MNEGKAITIGAGQMGFDYEGLELGARERVLEHTADIRGLMRRAAQDIINIGQRLIQVKADLPHGQFGPWLRAEFAWSWDTAHRFMRVAETFQNRQIADLQIAPSALYLLASPSTLESTREEALQRARQGEKITHALAQEIVSLQADPSTPTAAQQQSWGAEAFPPWPVDPHTHPGEIVDLEEWESEELLDKEEPVTRKSRIQNDFYETAEGLTQALLDLCPELSVAQILEPCAGDGAIARLFPDCITNDIDPQRPCDHDFDATDPAIWDEFEDVDWVVTNPPFSQASLILPLALEHARVGVAFLLRLTYLEPCSDRAEWLITHADQMRFCLPCNPRPQFRQDTDSTDSTTVAWFVWLKDWSWSDHGILPPFHFITGWR